MREEEGGVVPAHLGPPDTAGPGDAGGNGARVKLPGAAASPRLGRALRQHLRLAQRHLRVQRDCGSTSCSSSPTRSAWTSSTRHGPPLHGDVPAHLGVGRRASPSLLLAVAVEAPPSSFPTARALLLRRPRSAPPPTPPRGPRERRPAGEPARCSSSRRPPTAPPLAARAPPRCPSPVADTLPLSRRQSQRTERERDEDGREERKRERRMMRQC